MCRLLPSQESNTNLCKNTLVLHRFVKIYTDPCKKHFVLHRFVYFSADDLNQPAAILPQTQISAVL